MTISRATCPRAWDARRSVVLAVAGLLAGMALASGPDPTEPLSPALASQPLSRALAAYARHTGIQVIYVSAVVRGQQSAALPAGLVPAEALLRLLEHSGLSGYLRRLTTPGHSRTGRGREGHSQR